MLPYQGNGGDGAGRGHGGGRNGGNGMYGKNPVNATNGTNMDNAVGNDRVGSPEVDVNAFFLQQRLRAAASDGDNARGLAPLEQGVHNEALLYTSLYGGGSRVSSFEARRQETRAVHGSRRAMSHNDLEPIQSGVAMEGEHSRTVPTPRTPGNPRMPISGTPRSILKQPGSAPRLSPNKVTFADNPTEISGQARTNTISVTNGSALRASVPAAAGDIIPRSPRAVREDPQSRFPGAACIFVANLPEHLSQDDLRTRLLLEFSTMGEVYIKVKRTREGMPYAFLQYTDARHAEAAMDLNGVEIEGRSMRIEPASSRRFWFVARTDGQRFEAAEIANLIARDGEAMIEKADDDLLDVMGRNFGYRVVFEQWNDSRDLRKTLRKGYYVASIDDSQVARTAQRLRFQRGGGGPSRQPALLPAPVSQQNTRNNTQSSQSSQNMNLAPANADPACIRSIYVGNLPVDVTDQEIRRLANRAGRVLNIDIRAIPGKDATFAFIMFSHPQGVNNAITGMHGNMLRGHRIAVERRRPRGPPVRAVSGPARPMRPSPSARPAPVAPTAPVAPAVPAVPAAMMLPPASPMGAAPMHPAYMPAPPSPHGYSNYHYYTFGPGPHHPPGGYGPTPPAAPFHGNAGVYWMPPPPPYPGYGGHGGPGGAGGDPYGPAPDQFDPAHFDENNGQN